MERVLRLNTRVVEYRDRVRFPTTMAVIHITNRLRESNQGLPSCEVEHH